MTIRSNRLNPLLDLPAAQDLAELLREQPDLAAVFCRLLWQLGEESERKAEYAWQRRKAPMAAYWRACGVYARHIARAFGHHGAEGASEGRSGQ